MPIIYQPRGKALEYSDLAANLYTGCSHACRYCYCPAILRKKLDDWADDPKPRRQRSTLDRRRLRPWFAASRCFARSFSNDLFLLNNTSDQRERVLVRSGSSDRPSAPDLILERYGLKVQVLTKGGRRSMGDFDILARNHWKYGATIIFRDEKLREEWEPGAAPIEERIEAIREARRQGIFTWVSVEPVVDADEALAVMRELKDVVDLWKVGKLNHDKEREAAIDWSRFLVETEKILNGKNFIIKKDLEKFRTAGPSTDSSFRSLK